MAGHFLSFRGRYRDIEVSIIGIDGLDHSEELDRSEDSFAVLPGVSGFPSDVGIDVKVQEAVAPARLIETRHHHGGRRGLITVLIKAIGRLGIATVGSGGDLGGLR